MFARTAWLTSALRSCASSVSSRLSIDGRTRSTIDRRLGDWFGAGPAQLLERGQDRAALRVAEDDDQRRAVALGGELDAADLRWRDDVAGDANDEQVAQSLVEHDLRRYAGIGTSEDDGERLLAVRQLRTPARADGVVGGAQPRGEAAVAVLQALERFRRRNHRFRVIAR